MMKSAKLSAIAFALLLIPLGCRHMEPDCNAASTQPSWRTKLQNGSIFFPYSWCLAFKVLSVSPHIVREDKIDHADLDVKVKVEYVLREGTQTSELATNYRGKRFHEAPIRVGDTVTFCLSTETNWDLKRYIDSLKGNTQVWAFSTWSRLNNGKRLHFEIEQRFEPFQNREFSKQDLNELAADLAKVITDPQEAKRPIEEYLRQRWSENRIREFCHKDNRLIIGMAIPDPDEFMLDCRPGDLSLRGTLYPQSGLGEVMWKADTTNNTPTSYGLVVKHGKSVWQLERPYFELGSSFNEDDALKIRIHDTLSYARATRYNPFYRHRRPQAIFSTDPLPRFPDWRTFTIEKVLNTGEVVAVGCETSAGRLRALLDMNKEIQTVTVNGKQDNDWVEDLAEANKERSRLYDE
jgi:hypothetical protein